MLVRPLTIYTPKHLVAEILKRSSYLPSAVEIGGGKLGDLISRGRGQPRAILFRQIATPNYEFRQFLRACKRSGYSPVILQYHNDKMSCHNVYKRSLVSPMFIEGVGRRGQPYFRRQSLINVETVEKLRLCDVAVHGRKLPAFHHELLLRALPDELFQSIEGSEVLSSYPSGAKDYYVDLFSTLTGNLILFEDFVTDEAESQFYDQVVRPAFDAACALIGQRPVVQRICDNRRSASPLWYAYPASYRTHFNALGCNL